MTISNIINIVRDLIAENIQRTPAVLVRRDWARHIRRAVPEQRNAYGYPVAQDANLTIRSAL